MIQIASQFKSETTPPWHQHLLTMLPAIRRQAQIAFRDRDPETRQESVQEVIAHAAVVHDRSTPELAYPSVLAMYGIKRVKVGRRVRASQNVHDVSSEFCQLQKHVTVERLDRYDRDVDEWREVLVEDRHARPAQTAASRIDLG